MSGDRNQGYIPDPDFEGWDGTYLGVKNAPPLTHHLQKMSRYAKEKGKRLDELSEYEIEMFRIPGR